MQQFCHIGAKKCLCARGNHQIHIPMKFVLLVQAADDTKHQRDFADFLNGAKINLKSALGYRTNRCSHI